MFHSRFKSSGIQQHPPEAKDECTLHNQKGDMLQRRVQVRLV